MISKKPQITTGEVKLTMPLIQVKKNYQITIPQKLRTVLKIREGDIMEAEIEGSLIVLKPKSLIDKTELDRQSWIKGLIETGAKNPVNVSEDEIIKG